MKLNKKSALLLILCIFFTLLSNGQGEGSKYLLVKVSIKNQEQHLLLQSLKPDFASARIDSFAEIIIDEKGLLELQNHGFEAQILQELSPQPIDQEYHRYQQVLDLLDNYHKTYPEITFLDTIGLGQRLGLYIPAIKISDNADKEEDEPAILYDGLHHANEPVSMESTLALLEYLLSNYGSDPQVTSWVNNTEIWIVPMLNPEGWYYLVENELGNPWWRKNLRDNNGNGVINPDVDGVDINRNYNFNWSIGGSGNPGSWTYRGPEVFSESEARAKRDLALDQKFVMSFSYHSYGEIVIYSWQESPRAPDQDLILEIADSIASRIPKFAGGGSYNPRVSNCQTGFSRCWMYGEAGTLEFTIETASSFMPAGVDGLSIAQDNIPGALYILDRVNGPGISGHILDKLSGQPLEADYKVLEIYDEILNIRRSDSLYGRYDRLLQPGEYTLQISKEGYKTENITNIRVEDGDMTKIDVFLIPVVSGIEDLQALPYDGAIRLSQNYPNPFLSSTSIKYFTTEADNIRIDVIDLLGRTVATLVDDWHMPGEFVASWDGTNAYGKKQAAGFYIYRLISSDKILTRNLTIYR